MENEMLTVEELCAWLKVTRKTTERWRKDGLPYIKVGRSVRFEKDEVLKWLKDNQREGQKQ
jgi:excisionase family DNA binding protein